VRAQAQLGEAGGDDVVVVLVGFHPWVVQVRDLGAGVCIGDEFGQLADRERLGELVEHPELAALGGVLDGEPHAVGGVTRRCRWPGRWESRDQ